MKDAWKTKAGHLCLAYTLGIILTIGYLIANRVIVEKAVEDPRGAADNLTILALLYLGSIIVCYVWYCVSLSKFAALQTNEENRSSVNKVLGGNILLVAGGILAAIVAVIFIVILTQSNVSAKTGITAVTILPVLILSTPPYLAYRKMEKGYRRLSHSEAFNEDCQKGFMKLRQSATLKKLIVVIYAALCIGSVCLLMSVSTDEEFYNTANKIKGISIIATLVMFIMAIVAICKLLAGWLTVRNNAPETEEETTL